MQVTEGDVLILQTSEGGELCLENGVVMLTAGMGNAVYFSLFGGNLEDDGRSENNLEWWGNLGERVNSRKYRSETQFLLRSIPANSANLLRIEDSVLRDLAWLTSENIASEIFVSVTIPQLNKVKISIKVQAFGEETEFEFVTNWKIAA